MERIPPGQSLSLFQGTEKPTTWIVEVTPKDGEVYAAMLKVESPVAFSDAEKARLINSLSKVTTLQTMPLSRTIGVGEIVGCGILNRGDRTVTVEIRSRRGEAAK